MGNTPAFGGEDPPQHLHPMLELLHAYEAFAYPAPSSTVEQVRRDRFVTRSVTDEAAV